MLSALELKLEWTTFSAVDAGVCFNFCEIELREDACMFLAAVEFIINYSRVGIQNLNNIPFFS